MLIGAVPAEKGAVAAALFHQSSVDGGNLHVAVVHQSHDVYWPRVARFYGVGVGIDLVFLQRIGREKGLALHRTEAGCCADVECSGGVVEGKALNGVRKEGAVFGRVVG